VPDPNDLSVDETREIAQALRKRFPEMVAPAKDDICYATQNRQDAVKELIKRGYRFAPGRGLPQQLELDSAL